MVSVFFSVVFGVVPGYGHDNASLADATADALVRVAAATKTALGQSRAQLTFSEVDGFVYFEPLDSGGEQRWGF
jgi:hypothetical protein